MAAQLAVSRATVSKLLRNAGDRGFVCIEIHDPRGVFSHMGQELCARFGLARAHVVAAAGSEHELFQELGGMGAQVLEGLVTDGDLVGVTWGRTMRAVTHALTPQPRTGVQMVQLRGRSALASPVTGHYETVKLFCAAFDAHPHTVPLPMLFDDPRIKRLVERDRHIAHVLELHRAARVAVFTVGSADRDAPLLAGDYLTPAEREAVARHAVGDMCSRFVDATGQPAVVDLDKRTVGLSLDALRRKEVRLCVAAVAVAATVPALKAVLGAGHISHLVADERTARAVLG